ncbi:MAG: hypothetical protein M5U19_06990 [Microthrixaceae bacterium]|nr:hypothetical protein [Microthrixaceae bacterium]
MLIGEFGTRARDSVAPEIAHGLEIGFLDRSEWDRALENNPYLG